MQRIIPSHFAVCVELGGTTFILRARLLAVGPRSLQPCEALFLANRYTSSFLQN